MFTLISTKSPAAIQSILHLNSNHPPHLPFLYHAASIYHIYTTPQLFLPLHTIYRKLFYSAKLTNHHPASLAAISVTANSQQAQIILFGDICRAFRKT